MMNEPKADHLRILALDDEQHILDLYAEFLFSEASPNHFDLTLSRQAQEAVEAVRAANEEEKPFAVAFLDVRISSGPDGVWASEQIRKLDPNLQIVMVTGFSDINPQEIVRRVPPADKLLYIRKPFFPEEIQQFALALGTKWRQEMQLHRTLSDLEAHVRRKTTELIEANEELTSEIHERKRAEEALRESEEKYRRLVENINDVIFATDERGVLTYISPTIESISGHSPVEIIGRHFIDFIHQEDLPRIMEAFKKVISGHLEPSEYRLLTKSGKTCWVRSSSRPLITKSRVAGLQGVLRDITDRKEAEEEKKQLESQLLQAQKMEAIGTLAGGVAHDFNNLLQAVQGYAQLLLLRKDSKGPDCHELNEIILAADRGAQLTQQLLTFCRKVESKRRPLSLNHEVTAVKKLLERTIPRMIEIKIQLTDDPKDVNADPVQIEQIIMNLAVNAADSMPEGGKLTIRTENMSLDEQYCQTNLEAQPGDYMVLVISDNGHGMDQETLEHIFDPFYTTKEVGKGTGLGLAMVYGIVKNHEGYITCYTKPGRGTTFKIYLPIIEQETEMIEAKESESSLEGGTETILFVDDEEYILNLGSQMLEKFGYTVLKAAEGESALELYRKEQERIDLVILDLIMPGMGGSKCLEELLKMDSIAKVIIASGYSPDGRTKKALEAGAKGFISKPYKISQMLKVVRDVLDGDLMH